MHPPIVSNNRKATDRLEDVEREMRRGIDHIGAAAFKPVYEHDQFHAALVRVFGYDPTEEKR